MSNWKKEFVTDHRHRANSLTYKECLKVKTNNPVGKKCVCVCVCIYIYIYIHSFCASHKNEKMLNLAHKKKKRNKLKLH